MIYVFYSIIIILLLALLLGQISNSLSIRRQSIFLKHKINKIMLTQAELAQQLTDLGTQLDKVSAEINAEIQKLTDAIAAAGTTTPEVDAALASLKAKVQSLDDLNPDA